MITMNHHPLHTNAWFAEHESPHGKNVVVGNLVYSLVLGMSVPDVSGSAIANLEVETLQHAKPTYPRRHHLRGDPCARQGASTSKGDRGIVTVETKGINQRGEEVCYFRRKVMVWTRDTAPPRRPSVRRIDLGPDDMSDQRIDPARERRSASAAADYEVARPSYPPRRSTRSRRARWARPRSPRRATSRPAPAS